MPLLLCVAVIAVLAAAPLLEEPSPPAVLKGIALADASQFPGSFTNYSPPELYGGGAPAETCFVCNSVNSDNVGTAANSVDPNNDINAATGDFSTTNTLFSAPDVGPSLKFDLSYDSAWAQSEETAAQGNPNYFPGVYGWGWGSNFNISTSNSGGDVTVTDVNNAQMTFKLPGYQDSCPVGDYEDFQKYTYPFSAEPYCAPQRVNAQLGYLPNYNAYQLSENGGKDVYVFVATTGQLIDEGNANSNALIATNIAESPGSGQCPNVSGTTCIVDTDSGGRSITQVVQTSTGSVSEIIDPASTQYNLGLNGKYLTSVTNVAHNSTSYFGYNNTAQNPIYDAQLATIEDPDTNITTIGYNSTGMANAERDALGNTTNYTFGNTCPDPACLGSAGSTAESQMTTVAYPDGETEVNHYLDGLLTSSSFGDASSSNANFETWTYNYTFPSASNQNGDTYERIVQPGAAQSTNTTVVVMDPAGNVYESNDVNGNVTQNMYNDTGGNDLNELCWTARPGVSVASNATCSTPPAGSTSYTYDQSGNRTSETDPLGNTTRYGYYETYSGGGLNSSNLDGLLCWEAQPSVTGAGSTCSGASGPSGAPAGATAYTYDSYGDQTAKTVDYGASPSLTSYAGGFNAYGQPGYTVPAQGQGSGNSASNPYATKYTYWPWGALETKTAPDSTAVTDTYDAADNLVGIQAPLNEAASYGYNADNQQCWSVKGSATASGTCAIPPTNATVTTYQPGTDAPATVTDPLGHQTQYLYQDHAYQTKPTEIIDPAQNEITYNAYDAYGNVCVSGPVPTLIDNPAQCNRISGDTAAQYNSAGSKLASWDAMGNETTYAYANPGYDSLVTSSTTAMNQTTSYTYDNDGRLVTTNEPNGNAVSVGYNNDGLKCAQAPVANASLGCSPSGAVGDTTYGYDGADELTAMQDNNGVSGAPPLNTNTYTNGTLTSASDDNGKTVSYLYGYSGELLCMAYAIGSPSCGSITSRATPSTANAIVNYGYDTALRTTSVTAWTGVPGANSITYGYGDALNPTSVTQIGYPTTAGETLSYQYDAAGNLKSATYGGTVLSGQADTYNYNNDEQLSNYSLLNGPTSPNVSYSSYKQVTSAQDPGQSTPNNYTVTPNGEITQVKQGTTVTQSAAFNQDGGVCWSLNGNSSNACGTAPSGATAYSYDANGQRTAQTTGSTTRSNGWNAFGQMCWTAPTSSSAGCGSAPSGASSYNYAGNGLRVSATTGANSTPFTWDLVSGGSTPLDMSDGTNNYVYGPLLFGGTAPIEQISGGSSTTTSFLASTPSGVQAVIAQGSQISATSPADKFSYGSVSAVGQLASKYGKTGPGGTFQLQVSPQHTGDAIVLSVGVFSSSPPTITSVSGGGCVWQKLTGTSDSTAGSDTELWLGTVNSTSPGSIITATYSSGTSVNTELNAQEYSNGTGGSTAWSADVVGNSHNDTASTTVSFPTLAPSSSGETYVGYAYVPNKSGAGTNPGFTYKSTQQGNSFIYNNNVSSAVSPTATQNTAGDSDAVGALLKASAGGSTGISPVGSLATQQGVGLSTLTVSPQQVGDAIVLAVGVFSSSAPTVTAVSGGNATWQKLTNTVDSTAGSDTELWLGTVTTAGSSTVTVSYSGSVSSITTELDAQEYTHGTGAGTTWSADGVGNVHTDTASPTVTFPTLVPSSSPDAYVGYAFVPNGQQQPSGSTSGFTYAVTGNMTQKHNLVIDNPAVSSSVSPTASENPSSGDSDAVGALLKASVGASSGPVVTSISPSAGTIDGGTSVSITGSNFTGATAVNFGGLAASSFTVNSSTSITAIAPAGAAGGVDITVTAAWSGDPLLEEATYSLYGQQTIQHGTDVTPFGFQGSYTDPSGFIYLINRYYDPNSAQFLNIDPAVGRTGHPYEFAEDHPFNATDPLGLCSGPDGICRNSSTGALNVNTSVDASDRPTTGSTPSSASTSAAGLGSVAAGIYATDALSHGQPIAVGYDLTAFDYETAVWFTRLLNFVNASAARRASAIRINDDLIATACGQTAITQAQQQGLSTSQGLAMGADCYGTLNTLADSVGGRRLVARAATSFSCIDVISGDGIGPAQPSLDRGDSQCNSSDAHLHNLFP